MNIKPDKIISDITNNNATNTAKKTIDDITHNSIEIFDNRFIYQLDLPGFIEKAKKGVEFFHKQSEKHNADAEKHIKGYLKTPFGPESRKMTALHTKSRASNDLKAVFEDIIKESETVQERGTFSSKIYPESKKPLIEFHSKTVNEFADDLLKTTDEELASPGYKTFYKGLEGLYGDWHQTLYGEQGTSNGLRNLVETKSYFLNRADVPQKDVQRVDKQIKEKLTKIDKIKKEIKAWKKHKELAGDDIPNIASYNMPKDFTEAVKTEVNKPEVTPAKAILGNVLASLQNKPNI